MSKTVKLRNYLIAARDADTTQQTKPLICGAKDLPCALLLAQSTEDYSMEPNDQLTGPTRRGFRRYVVPGPGAGRPARPSNSMGTQSVVVRYVGQ